MRSAGVVPHARESAKMARGYGLRTAFGLTLGAFAMVGSFLLFAGFEIGLAMVGVFCLMSLVWMALNSWALLFAMAEAESVEKETSPQAAEPAASVGTTP